MHTLFFLKSTKKSSGAESKGSESLHTTAQAILKTIHTIICYGSTNKGSAWKKITGILKFMNVLYKNRSSQAAKKIIKERGEVDFDTAIKNLFSDSEGWTWDESSGAFFKHGDDLQLLTLEKLTSIRSDVLNFIKIIYPDYTWDKETLTHLAAALAIYRSKFDICLRYTHPTKENIAQAQNHQRYFNLLGKGNVTRPEDREFFIRLTMEFIFDISIRYGYGNCSHMTDIAFIEAIASDLECTITYVTLVNTADPTGETLNLVALGDWPQPGCLMIDAWHGTTGRTFEWKGTMEKTPEILEYELSLNKIVQIMQVSSKTPKQRNERAKFKQIIKETGYCDFLQDTERSENLGKINKYTQDFTSALSTRGLLDQSAVQESKEDTAPSVSNGNN